MKVRVGGAAALAVVLMVPGVSYGRSPASCRVVTDAAGDATGLMPTSDEALPGAGVVPGDPALDIVSGDLASDRRTVTGVVRVAQLGQPATSPVGSLYAVSFVVLEQRFTLQAMRDATGYARFLLVDGDEVGTKAVDVAGDFDTRRSQVRIDAPLSAFEQLGGKAPYGVRTQQITAVTERALGAQGSYAFQAADAADAHAQYRFGSPSCVRPGA